MFCKSADPPKRTLLDDVYDEMTAKRKAYYDLRAECEVAIRDAWPFSIRANLKHNSDITLKEPMIAEIMGEKVELWVYSDPAIPTELHAKYRLIFTCIKKVLADTWTGKGPAELEKHGFRFAVDPMIVTVDGYIFELALQTGKYGSDMTSWDVCDVISSEHAVKQKLHELWKVIKSQLGVGNSKYDCASAALGDSVKFENNIIVKFSNGNACQLRLIKLRAPC